MNVRKIISLAIFCFLIIEYFFIFYQVNNSRNYLYNRFKEKIASVDTTLNNYISDTKLVINGLGISILEQANNSNYRELSELIKNFDPRYNHDNEASIPFIGIVFVGAEKIKTNNLYAKKIDFLDIKQCIEENGSEPLKVNVRPIRIEKSIKEAIIPINMSIIDKKNHYIGTICSGLNLRELNKILSLHFDSRHLGSVQIINSNQSDNNFNIDTINSRKLLFSNFFNQSLILNHKLNKYNLTLQIELKHSFLRYAIYISFFFIMIVMIIFFVTIKLLTKFFKKSYEEPFILIQSKIKHLECFADIDTSSALSNFCPQKFSEQLNCLVELCEPILIENSHLTIERKKIKDHILNLMFIEQHYTTLNRSKIEESDLYSHKLYSIVKEEKVSLPLEEFLYLLGNYCCEFYNEFSINIVLSDSDKKIFNFKQSALIEVIFSVFTFILRSRLNPLNNSIIISASFVDNDFPTFKIELEIESYSKQLGWEVGPDFTHTTLLTIYLLAKENSLFFNISKNKNMLTFSFEPFNKKIEYYNLH